MSDPCAADESERYILDTIWDELSSRHEELLAIADNPVVSLTDLGRLQEVESMMCYIVERFPTKIMSWQKRAVENIKRREVGKTDLGHSHARNVYQSNQHGGRKRKAYIRPLRLSITRQIKPLQKPLTPSVYRMSLKYPLHVLSSP